MEELKKRIHDEKNGLDYVLVGDYYIPDIRLDEEPEDDRPIGKYGLLHREYLKEHRPVLYNNLVLSGKLHRYLKDLDGQAHERLDVIVRQMAEAEGISEELKARQPMLWVQSMNSIRARAEEVVLTEMVYI